MNLEAWHLFVAAALIFTADLFLADFTFLWIAMGTVATAVVLWFFPDLSLAQTLLVFAVLSALSFALLYTSRRLRGGGAGEGRALHRRADALIGRTLVLERAIEGGSGQARVGDGLWLATGPPLPAGSQVVVVGVEGTALVVEPAASGDARAARAEGEEPPAP